jgi:hypothetical protein
MTALDLLDAGFKQAEVVFLMRYLRPELEGRFADLLKPPSLIGRQRSLAKTYPHLPVYTEKGKAYADNRLFVVLQKIEIDLARLLWTVQKDPVDCLSKSSGLILPI